MQLQCSIDNSILLCNGGLWYHSPCPHRATHTGGRRRRGGTLHFVIQRAHRNTIDFSSSAALFFYHPNQSTSQQSPATALDDLFSLLFCVFCGTWIASYIAFSCLVAHSNISATSTKDATEERSPSPFVHDPTDQITYSSGVRAHMTESRPRDNRTLRGMPGASAHFPLIVVLSPVKWCLFAKEERAHLHTVVVFLCMPFKFYESRKNQSHYIPHLSLEGLCSSTKRSPYLFLPFTRLFISRRYKRAAFKASNVYW